MAKRKERDDQSIEYLTACVENLHVRVQHMQASLLELRRLERGTQAMRHMQLYGPPCKQAVEEDEDALLCAD